MQAQTLQARKATGNAWLVIAAVAVVATLLAIALAATLNNGTAGTRPARPVSITTVDDTGTGAYPGFVPGGAMAKHEATTPAATGHAATTAGSFTPPLRKPFS
jgi:hypothetical protein